MRTEQLQIMKTFLGNNKINKPMRRVGGFSSSNFTQYESNGNKKLYQSKTNLMKQKHT